MAHYSNLPTVAADWPSRRSSYAAIIGCSLLGLLGPHTAAIILGPVLALGLVVLGLAHGACDQLVLPALRRGPVKRGYASQFVLGYLTVAMVAALGWWRWPGAAVGAFFVLTGWHWGSGDAPAAPTRRTVWLAHSVLRGGLLLAGPAWAWPHETLLSVNGLLHLVGAAAIVPAQFTTAAAALALLVAGGHLALWAYYAWAGEAQRGRTDAGEVLLLAGLFWALPPLLALGVYFVFWHSLQHVLRLNRLFGYAAGPAAQTAWATLPGELLFFLRRAWPLLLVSLLGLALVYALGQAYLQGPESWLRLALLAAAILTLPHTLTVSVLMDAPKWRFRAKSVLE